MIFPFAVALAFGLKLICTLLLELLVQRSNIDNFVKVLYPY